MSEHFSEVIVNIICAFSSFSSFSEQGCFFSFFFFFLFWRSIKFVKSIILPKLHSINIMNIIDDVSLTFRCDLWLFTLLQCLYFYLCICTCAFYKACHLTKMHFIKNNSAFLLSLFQITCYAFALFILYKCPWKSLPC